MKKSIILTIAAFAMASAVFAQTEAKDSVWAAKQAAKAKKAKDVADLKAFQNKQKADLAAFARLRTDDGKKFHTIIPAANGGSGTIDGIPYIINSACGALSAATTTAGTYCMAYGNLKNYQLAVFSDIEVKRSEDYKFKEGMIAHKGVVFAGGNVVSYKGFLRVKKAQNA